jgi:hypothetical protein
MTQTVEQPTKEPKNLVSVDGKKEKSKQQRADVEDVEVISIDKG